MLVTKEACFDTIGGGTFEYKVIAEAQSMLISNSRQQKLQSFNLSASANQCCGGAVSVLFEPYFFNRPEIHIFGAGHVGKALVKILSQVNARTYWVDNREKEFPEQIDASVSIHTEKDINLYINKINPGSLCIIMTHSHNLDFQILELLLDRKDCKYIGLIGSNTKSLRFRKRLKSNAFSEKDINSFYCPIGVPELKGKYPMEIAVSIAAQVLPIINSTADQTSSELGLGKRQIDNLISELENEVVIEVES